MARVIGNIDEIDLEQITNLIEEEAKSVSIIKKQE